MKRIGGVPWQMTKGSGGDGEELKTEVTIMDSEYRERVKREEHAIVISVQVTDRERFSWPVDPFSRRRDHWS